MVSIGRLTVCGLDYVCQDALEGMGELHTVHCMQSDILLKLSEKFIFFLLLNKNCRIGDAQQTIPKISKLAVCNLINVLSILVSLLSRQCSGLNAPSLKG